MGFWTIATLKVTRKEDFCRVFNFVKPDEHDEEPQTDEEYKQVIDYVDTLSGGERTAWITRHCTRLYVDFSAKQDKLELSWSGRNEIGGWAEDISGLVVGQFPDVEFFISSICPDFSDYKYGVSEKGKVKWIKLGDDVQEMFEWGIDVDPYTGPTPENLEKLKQHRRARVQEMIDLGVNISIDQWPPTSEQFDEERRLKYGEPTPMEHNDDDPDLPF